MCGLNFVSSYEWFDQYLNIKRDITTTLDSEYSVTLLYDHWYDFEIKSSTN